MAVENFSTYDETDPNSHITVTTTRVTAAGITRGEDAYLLDDKGAGHFDGDFEHLFTIIGTALAHMSTITSYQLANVINDTRYFYDNNLDCLCTRLYRNDTLYTQYLQAFGPLGMVSDNWVFTPNTIYYEKLKRDEAEGTYGTLYLYIYDDSGRTNLVDTLSITLLSKIDFRYVFPMCSYNTGNAEFAASGYTENLDLQEAIAGFAHSQGIMI